MRRINDRDAMNGAARRGISRAHVFPSQSGPPRRMANRNDLSLDKFIVLPVHHGVCPGMADRDGAEIYCEWLRDLIKMAKVAATNTGGHRDHSNTHPQHSRSGAGPTDREGQAWSLARTQNRSNPTGRAATGLARPHHHRLPLRLTSIASKFAY